MEYVSTGQPTYWPTDLNKIPDLLDMFIINGINDNYIDIESCLDIYSDHTPIIITVSTMIIRKSQSPALYNNRTDWDSFRRWLDSNINLQISLKSEDDIDAATEYFTKLLQESTWKSTPTLSAKEENCINYPKEIRKKFQKKGNLEGFGKHTDALKTKLNLIRV